LGLDIPSFVFYVFSSITAKMYRQLKKRGLLRVNTSYLTKTECWTKSLLLKNVTDRMCCCFIARCRQRCSTRHSHSNSSSSCNSSSCSNSNSCNSSRGSHHPIRIMPGCYSRDTTHHTYYRSKYFRNLCLFHSVA
jgi:hypothetical protein